MTSYALKRGAVAVVKLVNPPVNGLNQAMRAGILEGLERARADGAKAVVMMGAGRTFPAGADIAEFARGEHRLEPDHNAVVNAMESYEIPIVAAIHGTALGGGLETALGAHFRIATPKSKVGLPEVHLGICPGAGGTQRLPRLTGVEKGVEIMTTGRMVGAAEALELGIVDELVEVADGDAGGDALEEAALDFVMSDKCLGADLADRQLCNRTVPGDTSSALLDELAASTSAKANGFTAPPAIAEAVRAAATSATFEEGLKKEAEIFDSLMSSPQGPALQHVFFAERECSKVAGLPRVDTRETIKEAAVIGAGTMGVGIAMCFSQIGIKTSLVDVTLAGAEQGVANMRATLERSSAYRKGKMSAEQVDALCALVVPVDGGAGGGDYAALSGADIVVEAAFENMDLKKDIFSRLDGSCKPGCILATNTSTLSVDEIAGATSRPESVVGTHFFSPANVMRLLENVRGPRTAPEVVAAVMDLGKRMKKVAVLAGDCWGFIGNRMLEPYMREGHFLVEEGAAPAEVDAVLKDKQRLGMAMGLFEMLDLAGNDVPWRQRQDRGDPEATLARGERYCSLGDKLCEDGAFGQKTGRGWYSYDPAAPRKPLASDETARLIEEHRASLAQGGGARGGAISETEILERCIYPLVNEGIKILGEGFADKPGDVDMTYLFGYGFPRYTGGPLFWAERHPEHGLQKILDSCERYREELPGQPWWEPSELLVEAVETGRTLAEIVAERRND